jgi:hypothetical protein
LYSRKYGTKNHDVYLAIRRGRITKQRDDEILASVLSSLVRGYYYSIRGDKYLQIRWNSVKPLLSQGPANQRPPALPPPADPADLESPAAQPETAAVKPKATRKKSRVKKAAKKAKRPAPKKAAQKRRKSRVPALSAAATAFAVGSVSGRLRELSGRSYDLYQDRFLAKARPAIRKVLGAGKGMFFTLPEKAENLVYQFLENHYSDPYMNWAESGERTELAEMGFELESLFPVIDECYRIL